MDKTDRMTKLAIFSLIVCIILIAIAAINHYLMFFSPLRQYDRNAIEIGFYLSIIGFISGLIAFFSFRKLKVSAEGKTLSCLGLIISAIVMMLYPFCYIGMVIIDAGT
jgi:hypothetical protein